MQARHAYLLTMITTCLTEGKGSYFLFLTASIYASIISKSSAMYSSSSGCEFLHAVIRRRDGLKDDLTTHQQRRLHGAVKANEVEWGRIDSALQEAPKRSDAAFVSNSAGANDTMAERRPLSCAHDRDPTLGEGRESGGLSRDCGESPSRVI